MINVPAISKKRADGLYLFDKTHLGGSFPSELEPGQTNTGKGQPHCYVKQPGVVTTVSLTTTVMANQEIFQRSLEEAEYQGDRGKDDQRPSHYPVNTSMVMASIMAMTMAAMRLLVSFFDFPWKENGKN